MKKAASYDVFLSYNQRDQGLARFVVEALSEQGLSVFQLDNLRPGVSVEKRIRDALVECSSVVILVTPSSVESQHLAFETGMALAWSKPIYVLYDGVSVSEIPEFLLRFRVTPVGEVSHIGETISSSTSTLAEHEVEILGKLYAANGIPVDQLILQSAALSSLTREFNSLTGLKVGGERIARELMKLRKTRKLSRLDSVAHPA